MHEAAEKLRRERWIEDKTKKIKVRFRERSAMLTNVMDFIDCHHIEYTVSLTIFLYYYPSRAYTWIKYLLPKKKALGLTL